MRLLSKDGIETGMEGCRCFGVPPGLAPGTGEGAVPLLVGTPWAGVPVDATLTPGTTSPDGTSRPGTTYREEVGFMLPDSGTEKWNRRHLGSNISRNKDCFCNGSFGGGGPESFESSVLRGIVTTCRAIKLIKC